MLHKVISQACPSLLRLSQQLQGVVYYSVQIVVPALGDSISDGSIAAVLKKAGDAVAENETIAQVETDKVTIDIKAPSEGTILGIVVQEQDTVVPGQLVATLDDAAAKAKLVGASPPAKPADEAPQPTPQPAAAAAPAPPSPAAAAAHPPAAAGHRIPGIRFPPRVTADGHRISMLPAAEAAAILQQWKAGASQHAPATAAAAGGATGAAAHAAQGTTDNVFAAWAAAQRLAAQQNQAGPDVPSKFATSVTRLSAMPQHKELSQRDIELIELGGAAP